MNEPVLTDRERKVLAWAGTIAWAWHFRATGRHLSLLATADTGWAVPLLVDGREWKTRGVQVSLVTRN